jgi:GNAT superfamily N-acetyltransferase
VSLPADLIERPLTAGDLPALTDLARACDETYLAWAPAGWSVPEVPPDFATKYLTPSAWMRGAFDRSGTLVATVAFRVADHDAAVAHVGLVFVHPSRWRERIAATLLTLAESEMVARGFVREQLWTPDGAPAERFYTARGWSRDGRTEWHPWFGLQMVGYARDLEPPGTSTAPRLSEPRAGEARGDAAPPPRRDADEVAPSSPSGASPRRRGSRGGRARERRGHR